MPKDIGRLVEEEHAYIRSLEELATHIIAMENDSYLNGHPEWPEIVIEAKKLLWPI